VLDWKLKRCVTPLCITQAKNLPDLVGYLVSLSLRTDINIRKIKRLIM